MSLPRPPDRASRLIYLGTPELAVAPLRALHDAGYDVALVVSRPDKRRGRRGNAEPSPVKAAALDLGLPVTDQIGEVAAIEADLGVVVAYGRIIKLDLLERLPMVNLHFSLLPRWRGAAPVERAILAGDTETGVCLMAVEEGLDTGDVYRRTAESIRPDDTVDSLRTRLVDIGTAQLLDALANGFGVPEPQAGEPVHADKISTDDLRIDWSATSATIDRQVRVGGAHTTFRGSRLKVWEVSPDGEGPSSPGALDGVLVGTGDGVLTLITVQPEGKGRMAADAWQNGARPSAGERLGT